MVSGVFLIPGECLTLLAFRCIVSANFRKGALLMNWFGFVAVLPANTVEHVRTIVVSDFRKFREE